MYHILYTYSIIYVVGGSFEVYFSSFTWMHGEMIQHLRRFNHQLSPTRKLEMKTHICKIHYSAQKEFLY